MKIVFSNFNSVYTLMYCISIHTLYLFIHREQKQREVFNLTERKEWNCSDEERIGSHTSAHGGMGHWACMWVWGQSRGIVHTRPSYCLDSVLIAVSVERFLNPFYDYSMTSESLFTVEWNRKKFRFRKFVVLWDVTTNNKRQAT